jgi:chromosome partitioning related protein ParA
MSIVFAAISTKGGVGKTTLLANFGGLLADIGYRVLLVDADTQPSLTSYYAFDYEAPRGLVEVVTDGTVDETTISRTRFPNLHLIRSNDGAAELQHWLHSRPDRRTRLRSAFATPAVADAYDIVLIDTQGAIGPLQTAAAFAADKLVSPLPPDTPSAREFRRGTLAVLRRLELPDSDEPTARLAPIAAVICRVDKTRDAKEIVDTIRAEFAEGDRVQVLDTFIPAAVVYRSAFTQGLPAHQCEVARGRASAFETMHRLTWELHPASYGLFAGGLRGDPDDVFGPPKDEPARSSSAARAA